MQIAVSPYYQIVNSWKRKLFNYMKINYLQKLLIQFNPIDRHVYG